MRSHNCNALNLDAYQKLYDFYIPMVSIYDDIRGEFVSSTVSEIRLVPDHIEFELDYYANYGYFEPTNETDLNACDIMTVYGLVEKIFRAVDEGTVKIHETLFEED